MKHKIKNLAESTPVAWGTIAEKIDENFEELESTIGEGGDSSGINEAQLGEYLERNEYAKKSDIPSLEDYATEEELAGKVDKIEGKQLSTEDFTTEYKNKLDSLGGDSGTAKSSISILFVGNSLTQDGIAYLPYMLKTYYPEIDFHIYMWYIGGKTLADHYSAFTSEGKAEVFSVAENSASWTNGNENTTMSTVLNTYSFDIVCMQEYFNYKTKYEEVTDYNNCRDYIISNYKGGNALEFISLFHAPLRKDGYDVDEVYKRVEAGNALILQESISQDMIPNGIAVYRALDTDLNSLGDLGQLSPDGTHTQEGLPCLLQTYVTLCWLFDRLGINKSVYGHPMRMTSSIYNSINVPGANLGSGVIKGTDAQNLLAQEVAIKAYKEGKQFVCNNLSPYGGGAGAIKNYTFAITTNTIGATIKINGVEQSSVSVLSGSVVNWEVSKDGYLSQSGSEVVIGNVTKNIILVTIVGINSVTAEFAQGERTIFSTDNIEDLRKYLVVTVDYEDGSTMVVDDYTLSGELTAGISSIVVNFGGTTTTFDVDVTAFEIPENYTRYDYIQKKTTSQSKVAPSNFIYLNEYEDYNTLSMEAIIAHKANPAGDEAGILGARLESGSGINYYAIYWKSGSGTVNARLRNMTCAYTVPTTTKKATIVVDNPSTSPLTVKINDGEAVEYNWTDSLVIPHPMSLFNNLPHGSTATYYINRDSQIGDLIFRKENGECVGYYTPVVYDGKIGMYDQISKTFYTAATASVVTISNSACLYSVGNW